MPLIKPITSAVLDQLRNSSDASAKFILGMVIYFGFFVSPNSDLGKTHMLEAEDSDAYHLYALIAGDRYGLTSRDAAWSFILLSLSLGLFGLPETPCAQVALKTCADQCRPLASLCAAALPTEAVAPSP